MSELPDREIDAYTMTAFEATDLARDGQVLDGYRCLLGGQARAEELREDGEPWAAELCALYAKALLRFGEEWGAQVE